MKNIVKFAVGNPVTICMIVFALLLLGKVSYDQLSVDLLPDLNNPRLFIELKVGERPPEEIEKQFVKNMESMAIRQSDVTQVSSVIKAGTARITVEYIWTKDMDEAFLDLQKAMNPFAQNKEITELKITQHDANLSPVVLVGMSHQNITDMAELRRIAESYIRNELIRLEGVAEVTLSGEEVTTLTVQTDPYKLNAFQLKIEDIASRIESNNQSISGGRVSELGLQYLVKSSSLFSTEADFENLIVGYKPVQQETSGNSSSETVTDVNKAPVFLEEVATVQFVNARPENIVRINGKRSIGLSIYKEMRFNTVKVVDEVTSRLAVIENALPGYHFQVISNQGTFIKSAIGEVKSSAILGIVLAVIVLFVFLRRMGTTLIVSLSIPISIVATFNLMFFNGLTLNIMTLGGLALGAGMLVDNAIVVIESIFRNQEKGVSVKEAVVTGTEEVANAVIASTLTTIVVFLPIVYLHGASGELFKDQAWTVTFSLVSSLFVAILVIPMLYTQLSGKKVKMEEVKSIRITRYSKILRKLVRHRWWVIGMAVLLLVVTGLLTPFIGTEFMPRAESKAFTAVVKMPEGTQMERTAAAVGNLEDLLYTIVGGDSLCTIYSHVGEGSGSENAIFEGENTAMMKIILFPECILSPENVIARFLEEAKNPDGLELSIRQDENSLSSLLGSEGAPIVVEVKGEELDEIAKITGEVKERMQEVDGVYDVVTSIEDGAPEVVISIDRTIAGINNLSVATVIEQLKQQLSGKEAGKMEYRGEMRDIVIKVPDISLGALGSLVIRSGTQEFLLDEISSITHGQAPKEILRRNQSRIGKIMANMDTGKSLDKVAAEVRLAVKDIDLPANYSITVTGEEEKRQESMHSLLFALLLSVVLVYMVMASQFESLLHPFTILLTIPLAVVGAILLFFITGTTINMMGVIGIVMLGGIAVNNSIILVDRINQLSQAGMELTDAIVEAGQQRIRPIIMTTLTTILAMLPMTFGFGEGASLRSPMAIAVIGGLITSTLMSLMVIPCVYYVLEMIKRRINHRTKKKLKMNFLLNRRITICMLFIALSLLGYVSYKQLPVELLPNAELPVLFIQVSSQQDMDPSYVESEVIIPLEGAVSTIGGVDKLQSYIGRRQSNIQIDFKKNVNFKMTALKLQEKVNEVAASFPSGFTVQVQKVDIAQMNNNFMVLQVRGSGGTDRVRNLVEDNILSDLENIDGVASVNIYGGRQKAIEIRLHSEVCKALNLTASKISNLLSQNTQEKTFVGFANEPDSKIFVHVNAMYTKVSDLENIVVAPGPVLLKDVATVFFDLKDETTYSRVNGKEAVSVALINDSQANLIELSHRVSDAIDKLNEKIVPLDLEIVVQENKAETMENNINQIINLALVGGLLAVFILWLFLKNMRLVFFIALSIPISVYTAFNFFYASGITINSLTLVGMALAIGMLLDNSVVVLENIYRLSGSGYTPERSVTQGTKEVWRSIVAATLTTVTVFLPFVFSDNFLIKLIGHHIGVSIISTLTISLFVALLFIPMVTYVILKKKKGRSVVYEKVSIIQRPIQVYLVLLKTCMRNPGVTIFGAVILLFATLILSLTLNVQQMKEVDSDRFNISVVMPTGSTLENTDKIVKVLEERLKDFPEKKDLICRVREKEATITLVLQKDYQKIGKRKITDIKSDVQSKVSNINGAEVYVSDAMGGGQENSVLSSLGGFMRLLGIGDNNERVVVRGSDFEMMQMVAEEIRYLLDEQEFVQHTHVSYTPRQPEINLNFDPILLTTYDINRANITSGLTALNNEFSSEVTFKVGEDNYDIIIRDEILKKSTETEEEAEEKVQKEKTVDDLRAVRIENAKGGMHNLEDIASINYGRGRSRIIRVNQDKQLEVYYNFSRDVQSSKELLGSYRSDIDQLIAGYNLPSGVALQVFHEEDQFGDFKFLILAAFILIFMILASVFESVVTPFVLLFTIPLAAIGSLLALLLSSNSLMNANTLTGFLILLGVVVNNGIILIDYANILRKRGYRRNRALMTAGMSRIRPILITSITTIAAMLPLAMGDTEYAGAIGAPFAITVIGGLLFSALLTLILIPTVCMGLENVLWWYRSLSRKMWIFHFVLFVVGVVSIWLYAEGILWQSIYLVALIAGIPGLTYFTQTSLRRAKSKVIDPNEEIHISVRNLVKIYDWPGRISRQWHSGLQIRKRLGMSREYHSLKDFVNVLWQFGMLAFGVYFTYFFIQNRLWIFLFSFAIYASALYLWRKIRSYLYYRYENSKGVKAVNRVIFWGLPPVILFELFKRLDNNGLVVMIGLLWFAGIAIYVTSQYLYEHNVNIERVTGRFAGLRRSYFRMVKSVPLIGKQRKPFKALRGVSFEIQTGMFGLLGPNGAGKSTLMRVICGIFEQSYGSIWINGMDTRIYREELQSLIGFLPQEFGTYENMTSWEFLDYQAILKGIIDEDLRKERLEYVLNAVHMYERKDENIGSFSGGMKQRIGIALILLHLPRILVVDEPTAGLDPRERIRFRNLLVELSKDRVVIFSTHIIEDISSSCNQVVVINKGELKYFGDPADMVEMANGKVWQFNIDKTEFEKALDKSLVIHHIQQGDTIRVRYLSVEQPYEGAEEVEANLEDAYLCLLKNMN